MNKQQNKQMLLTTHIYIHISCKCDTNRAGHFTLDAHASKPVACLTPVNTLKPRQNGRHFPDDIEIRFLEWKCKNFDYDFTEWIQGVQLTILQHWFRYWQWCLLGNKPLSEPMMVSVYWRTYASLGLNELIGMNMMRAKKTKLSTTGLFERNLVDSSHKWPVMWERISLQLRHRSPSIWFLNSAVRYRYREYQDTGWRRYNRSNVARYCVQHLYLILAWRAVI